MLLLRTLPPIIGAAESLISVTAASAESDLDQIYTLLKNKRRWGSRYGDMEVWSFVLFIFFRQTWRLGFSFFSLFFLFHIVSAIEWCLNSTKLARISLSPTTFTSLLSQFKSVSGWQLHRQQLSEAPA